MKPDLIELLDAVLARLSHNDQLIIVACELGHSDRGVARLVPHADWGTSRLRPYNTTSGRPRPGARLSGPPSDRSGIPRRIAAAYRRFDQTIDALDDISVPDLCALREADLPDYVTRSGYVQEMCADHGILPAIRRVHCAVLGCTAVWVERPSLRGGRPRRTCSDRCRQRLTRTLSIQTPD